jgi:hypothetical protein
MDSRFILNKSEVGFSISFAVYVWFINTLQYTLSRVSELFSWRGFEPENPSFARYPQSLISIHRENKDTSTKCYYTRLCPKVSGLDAWR